MKKFKKIALWFLRLIIWIFSGFGFFNKILNFRAGWDTLHPLAPYSFGGTSRDQFLVLLKKNREESITIDDVNLMRYNVTSIHNIKREMISKNFVRKAFIYRYFLSPWKKDENYNRD